MKQNIKKINHCKVCPHIKILLLGMIIGPLSSFAQTEDLLEGQASIEELRQDIRDLTSTIERMQKRIEALESTQKSTPPSPPLAEEPPEPSVPSSPASVQKEESLDLKEPPSEKEEKRLESDLKKAKLRWVKGPMPQGMGEKEQEILQPFSQKESSSKSKVSTPSTEISGSTAEKYEKARAALAEGDAPKAKKFFQALIEKNNHPFYAESLYWIGVIYLLEDSRPREAASYLSRSYQECLKAKKEKPLIFRQSVLLKLVEALVESGQKKNANLILKKFFELDEEKSKLSSADLSTYKKLHKKAMSFKKKL